MHVALSLCHSNLFISILVVVVPFHTTVVSASTLSQSVQLTLMQVPHLSLAVLYVHYRDTLLPPWLYNSPTAGLQKSYGISKQRQTIRSLMTSLLHIRQVDTCHHLGLKSFHKGHSYIIGCPERGATYHMCCSLRKSPNMFSRLYKQGVSCYISSARDGPASTLLCV